MKTYYVTVRVEEIIEVQENNEADAVNAALMYFDPGPLDREVVEIYTNDEE